MSSKVHVLLVALSLAAFAASDAAAAPVLRVEAPTLLALNVAPLRTTVLTGSGARRLASLSWTGGSYLTSTGESIVVYVSTSYSDDGSVGRRWADYFVSLLHGPELASVRVYVAPLAEVQQVCQGDALGCYGGSRLIMPGDLAGGVSAASIAAHEYGHHIAANRLNPPWRALDWGTKRWASYTGVCGRVAAGTAFPGDEGLNYFFNPGEAFAESYRVLIETNGTATGDDWPLVDPSFRPNAESLAAVREDVLDPWSGPRTRTIRGKFLRRSRTWSAQVATPFDGDLRILVDVPGGGGDDVKLFSSDGRTLLATGSWDTSGGKTVEYRVCGTRSVRVRVSRGGAAARFSLRVTVP